MARFLTICESDTAGAEKIYLSLREGDDGFFAVAREYTDAEAEKIRAEGAGYELKCHRMEDTSTFKGFVAGMSYEDDDSVSSVAIEDTMILVKEGAFGGCIISARYVSYHSDYDDTAERDTRMVWIPTSGEWIKTLHYYWVQVYGHDGEEDDSRVHEEHALIKQ